MVAPSSVGLVKSYSARRHVDLEGLDYQYSLRWPIIQLIFAVPPFPAPRNIDFHLSYFSSVPTKRVAEPHFLPATRAWQWLN
jgi:hypothetical protein